MEETQQEPKEEQSSPHSPSPMAMAWDSGAMPSADQPLSHHDSGFKDCRCVQEQGR